MSSSGFSYIWRGIERFFRNFDASNRGHQERGHSSHILNSEELINELDEETSAMLTKLADRESVDAIDYALDLLSYTIKLHYREIDQRITFWNNLTRREQDVAALVCQGKTNSEIAMTLSISGETVKKHVSSVLRKFSVKGRGVLRWSLEDWSFQNIEKPWER